MRQLNVPMKEQGKAQELLSEASRQFPSCPNAKEIVYAAVNNKRSAAHDETLSNYEKIDRIFKAWIRHDFTDYEERIARGTNRTQARTDTWPKVASIIRQWQQRKQEGSSNESKGSLCSHS